MLFAEIFYRDIAWRMKGFLVLCLTLSFFAVGCAPSGGPETFGRPGQGSTGDNKGARLSVFLNLKEHSGPGIRLRISAVEILAGGQWMPLISEPLEIDASEIKGKQILLSSKSLPPQSYNSLRIKIEKATIHRQEKVVFLALQKPELLVPISPAINLERDDSQSLFITWDVAASIHEIAIIDPVMAAEPQSSLLISDLAYVACPDIDTVYIIRTDRNWICGSLGIPGRPTYLAIVPSRNRLYVLATDKASIKVVELSTNRLVDSIQIPLASNPNFMTLSSDGLRAYILDGRSNHLVRMDLQSGTVAERVRLNYRPAYAAYLEDYQRLAVSSELSQAVYLLNPETLATMDDIPVSNSPQGLLLCKKLLYIAESASNAVSVYDLDARQIKARINVGISPRRLLLSRDQIYLSNYGGGSVSILLPGQLSVMREIPVGKAPLEMAISSGRRWLYVGNQKSRDLTVIDLTSNRVSGQIALGAVPLGLAVVDE